MRAEANSQAVSAATAAAQVYAAMPLMCLPYEEVNGQWQEAANPPPDCVPMTESAVESEYEPRVCGEATNTQGNLTSNAQYQVQHRNLHPTVDRGRRLFATS